MLKLSVASQIKLGLASPEVKEALLEAALAWMTEQILQSEERNRKLAVRRKKSRDDIPPDQVLPTGVVVAGALVAYAAADDDIRQEYNDKLDQFNFFNNRFTVLLNNHVFEIIENETLRIPGDPTTYRKIDGRNTEETRYLNTGLLITPTLAYINRNTFIFGLGKQYSEARTFVVHEKSVAIDLIIGIISTAVSGLSEAAARELLGVSEGTSDDMNGAVPEGEETTVYNFLSPLFFFDTIGKRVQCSYTTVTCRMDEETIIISKTCKSDEETKNITVRLGVESYAVDFLSLGFLVNSIPGAIEEGKEWSRMNIEGNRTAMTDDRDASMTPPPSYAKDVIL